MSDWFDVFLLFVCALLFVVGVSALAYFAFYGLIAKYGDEPPTGGPPTLVLNVDASNLDAAAIGAMQAEVLESLRRAA
jgi:hypothetical protein